MRTSENLTVLLFFYKNYIFIRYIFEIIKKNYDRYIFHTYL